MDREALAKLPEGSPSDRGLSLSDDIPGYKTFAKPEDDTNTDQNAPEQSQYRTDGPRDLAKHQDGGDDTIDQSQSSPGAYGLGDSDSGKTKYPYRDGIPNDHNAGLGDPQVVADRYVLERKQPLILRGFGGGKQASTAEQILSGLSNLVLQRSRRATVKLKRADIKNLRWIFEVQGNHTYAVKLKASRTKKNNTRLSKMELEIACTCPAWQWQGPEFHSTHNQYQLGKLMGTATPPNIRDPERINRVCKHVAAVLSYTRGWEIPALVVKQAVRQAMLKTRTK